MTSTSLLLITKNESSNLDNWHKWIHKLKNVNEIVVVDSQSIDDSTSKLNKLSSKKLKVKIFSANTQNNFSVLRTQALENCSNDWILWLDADETPTQEMIDFINTFDNENYNFSFCRQDFFLERQLKHGETANQHFIRLFNKNHGRFIGQVHEVWQSNKPIITTNFVIEHYSHRNFYSFIQKLNNYSSIRAIELSRQGIKANIFSVIFYPLAKFIKDYIIFLGLLDGTAGIIFALGMSFHSFLVRAKLWHLSQTF